MSIQPGLERIFEAWFDYEHSTDEDAKLHNKMKRSSLIVEAMQRDGVEGTVNDFLHSYRDRYREWVIRKGISRNRF